MLLGKTKQAIALSALHYSMPKAIGQGRMRASPVCEPIVRAFLHDEERTLYLEHLVNSVRGPLDVDRLKRAFEAMIARHDILRTNFTEDEVNGEIWAEVLSAEECCPLFEHHSKPELQAESREARQVLNDLQRLPLDASIVPWMRMDVVSLADEVHYIILSGSHAVVDGTSGPPFLRELCALYDGKALPKVPYQYSQFAAWQRRRLRTEKGQPTDLVEGQLVYWKKRLKDAPAYVNLALDARRPLVFRAQGKVVSIEVDPAIYARMTNFTERHRQSPWRVLMTCFYCMLRAHSGQKDILINIPKTTRLPIMLDTIGHFASSLPIRIGDQETGIESMNFLQAVKHIGVIMKEAVRNGDALFGDIVDRICSKFDPSYPQLCQVCLSVIQEEWMYLPRLHGMESMPLVHGANDNHRVTLDLHLRAFCAKNTLSLSMLYNSDIFLEETVRNMLQFMIGVLKECLDKEDIMLSDLSFSDSLASYQYWKSYLSGMPEQSLLYSDFVRQGAATDYLEETESLKYLSILQEHKGIENPIDILAGSVYFVLMRLFSDLEYIFLLDEQHDKNTLPFVRRAVYLLRCTMDAENLTISAKDFIEHIGDKRKCDCAIFSRTQLLFLGGVPAEGIRQSGRKLPQVSFRISDDGSLMPNDWFQISFILDDSPEGVSIKYNAALLDHASVRQLCAFVEAVMSHMLKAETLIKDLQLIDASSGQVGLSILLGPINEERLSAPLVHQEFERFAAEQPHRVCLIYEEEELSFGEVNIMANRVAHSLLEKGLQHGQIVGILLDRSFELVAGILGVLKAGAGYVPLDPAYPESRLNIYAQDSGAAFVLVQEQHVELAKNFGCKIILAEECLNEAMKSVNPEISGLNADSTCVLLFTSGSTGRPKGVHHVHRHLRENIMGTVELFGLGSEDVIMLTSTICFDMHLLQIFSPLVVGASLVISKPDGHMDGDYIASKICQHGVTGLLSTVPLLAKEYLMSPILRNKNHKMKHWILGGETVSLDLVRLMHEVFPSMTKGPFNGYGPSEFVWVTAYEFPQNPQISLIGVPSTNVQLSVVDSSSRVVPVGIPGELLLSGPRMAKGYFGRDDLTAEKFIRNPVLSFISTKIPESMGPYFQLAYRTGDLVRLRHDGNLEFLGRIDRQVKINGVRAEIEEIENILRSAPKVLDAVVSVVPHADKKVLCGYVIPASLEADLIRSACAISLLPSMIPSHIVCMDEFPLLPNGKVDVKSLPVPDWSLEEEQYVAPATEMEGLVCMVFEKVLQASQPVSVEGDFFLLGGTSLQAFKIVNLLKSLTGLVSISNTIVHNFRTPRKISGILRELTASEKNYETGITAQNWMDETRPLSPNQVQVWLLQKSGLGSAYNMPGGYYLDGIPNLTHLTAAFRLLLGRHEVLRLRYTSPNGEPMGIVVSEEKYELDFTVLKVESVDEGISMLQQDAKRGFDLERDSLLRIRLYLLPKEAKSNAKSMLLFVLHHSVADAWSINIILRELSQSYTSLCQGHKPRFDPLPVQYADYARWMSTRENAEAREYWSKSLAGAPTVLQISLDQPRPKQASNTAGYFRFKLPDATMRGLFNLSRAANVNLQAVYLNGIQLTLMKFTGSDDIIVGVPSACRDQPETQDLVGYFINTLPIRGTQIGISTILQGVHFTSKMVIGAMENSYLPLSTIVKLVHAETVPGMNPLFQVLCQYIPSKDLGESEKKIFDIPCTAVDLDLSQAKLDISFFFHDDGTVLTEFNAEIFGLETIEQICACVRHVLHLMASNPEAKLADVYLMDTDDVNNKFLSSLLGPINEQRMTAPLVHEEFEKIAAVSPEATCLIFEGEELTYGEVNARANHVAHVLLERGLQNGQLVGILLERSFDLIVGILGVLKAGGGYVPMDPSYPQDRLFIYAEDSNASFVLFQSTNAEKASSISQNLVCMEECDLPEGVQEVKNPRVPEVDEETTCLVLFTSGSTGRPKAVQHAHRHLREVSMGTVDYFSLVKDDVIMLTNTICFDVHIPQIFSPLVVGGSLVIAKPDGHTDPEYVASKIVEHKVTVSD